MVRSDMMFRMRTIEWDELERMYSKCNQSGGVVQRSK